MTLSITPERRAFLAQIGSIGGLSAAVNVDTEARARAGQSAFRRSFAYGHSCKVCPEVILHKADPAKAERLYRLHFKRIRLARR